MASGKGSIRKNKKRLKDLKSGKGGKGKTNWVQKTGNRLNRVFRKNRLKIKK